MKKLKMSIFMTLLLLLSFTISPILAAKNTWNIEYAFEGSIWDMDSAESARSSGMMMLTISGKIIGSPDYEYTKTVVDESVNYGYGEGSGYTYLGEDGKTYLLEYYTEATVMGFATYTEHRARWYSPQPTFNGKLVIEWGEGSTESLNVELSPSKIDKSDRDGTVSGTYTYRTTETLYIEDDNGMWEWVEETVIAEGEEDFTESYDESNVQIQFSGKMQCKGRPPLRGTLEIYDVVSGNYKIGYGEFGPYLLSIYQHVEQSTIPLPT